MSLSVPAPPARRTIYLWSGDASKVSVTPNDGTGTATVFIPGGRTSPNVQPIVNGINLGSTTIHAIAAGYTGDVQSVYVTATVAFARCCVTVTRTATANAAVTLSAPAPSGGLTIQLVSDNTGIATVPATVTFAAQTTCVNVPITGITPGSTTIRTVALPTLVSTSIKVAVP